MTLPTSGLITLLDIQNEFGGSNPIFLDEYYRGGGVVPIGTAAGTGSFQDTPLAYAAPAQIATSGTIQLSMFRGTSAVVPFVLNETITSDFNNLVMRNYATVSGWDGVNPLIMTITIAAGVTICSTSTTVAAVRTKLVGQPAFPAGSSLKIINNGTIAGRGGKGGNGASITSDTTWTSGGAGGAGGLALEATDALFVENNGIIGGGGGGGGGGAALLITVDAKLLTTRGYGGGGGGGGQGQAVVPGGNAGAAGTVSGGVETIYLGTAGNEGWTTYAGAGGSGANLPEAITSGSGGAGGTLGLPGSPGRTLVNGATTFAGGGGGAAGPAIDGNANITWGNLGTILGSGWTSPYSLSASANPVNEGSSVTITLNGTGISGTSVPYTITGVSSADISGGALSGNFVVGTAPTRVLTLAADGLTEGTETLTVALTPPSGQTSSPSVAVTINDTSFGAGELLASGSNIWDISNDTVYPTIASSRIQFRSDGITEYPANVVPPVVAAGSNWYTVQTPGIGNSYWIRFVIESQNGFTPQGSAINVWQQLNISRYWYISTALPWQMNVSGGFKEDETFFTIQIATDSAGTNIVRTYTGNRLYTSAVNSVD